MDNSVNVFPTALTTEVADLTTLPVIYITSGFCIERWINLDFLQWPLKIKTYINNKFILWTLRENMYNDFSALKWMDIQMYNGRSEIPRNNYVDQIWFHNKQWYCLSIWDILRDTLYHYIAENKSCCSSYKCCN